MKEINTVWTKDSLEEKNKQDNLILQDNFLSSWKQSPKEIDSIILGRTA